MKGDHKTLSRESHFLSLYMCKFLCIKPGNLPKEPIFYLVLCPSRHPILNLFPIFSKSIDESDQQVIFIYTPCSMTDIGLEEVLVVITNLLLSTT